MRSARLIVRLFPATVIPFRQKANYDIRNFHGLSRPNFGFLLGFTLIGEYNPKSGAFAETRID